MSKNSTTQVVVTPTPGAYDTSQLESIQLTPEMKLGLLVVSVEAINMEVGEKKLPGYEIIFKTRVEEHMFAPLMAIPRNHIIIADLKSPEGKA